MAKNVIINNVTYQSVPSVNIPLASGGGNAEFFDTSAANLSANDLRKGKTAFGASGEVAGNLTEIAAATEEITAKAQEISIAAGIHTGSGKVKISSAEQAKIVAGNIKSGVTILGVAGALSSASISQDSTTKELTIS